MSTGALIVVGIVLVVVWRCVVAPLLDRRDDRRDEDEYEQRSWPDPRYRRD